MKAQCAVYQCGLERVSRIRACLDLMLRYEEGSRMQPSALMVACVISRDLTEIEKQCMRLYYNDSRQQKQIASMLNRSQSSVSRALRRGEEKLAWALELPQLPG